MQVEIWSDVICPWCYIGKRRFEMALARFPQRESVTITWRSFELDPQSPAQYPYTLEEMLAKKYRVSPQQATAMNARVSGLAQEIGLQYRLADAHPGNTLDAHRLLHYAATRGLAAQATERLMHAYFCESLTVGERAALAALAPEFGISEAEAQQVLNSSAYTEDVRADEARAAELGISGVPYFLVDNKIAVPGAESVDTLVQALQQAL